MKRRELILASGALAILATARADAQPARPPRVGVLLAGGLGANDPFSVALKEGLQSLGFSEARRTVAFEFRNAEGQRDRLRSLAQDLVRAKVDVIVAGGDDAIAAARESTATLPIVMIASDAVSAGFVGNLARPNANLTGVTCVISDLSAKRLELLKEIFPKLARVGVILNPGDRRARAELAETESAGRTLKVAVRVIPLVRHEDFGPAFAVAVAERGEALVVAYDELTLNGRQQFAGLAIAYRQATVHSFSEHVLAGGLVSYGPSLAGMWRLAAGHVAKVLNGVRPADIPIEQPTRFELVVNLKTARALGITIPQPVLLRADRVIE